MNFRKSLFAVALTALAGSAFAAPQATPSAAATQPAAAKTTVAKHKHQMAKKTETTKSSAADGKKS